MSLYNDPLKPQKKEKENVKQSQLNTFPQYIRNPGCHFARAESDLTSLKRNSVLNVKVK